MLTEGAVRASGKRVLFIGIDVYEAAGETVLRDLFQADDGARPLSGLRLVRHALRARILVWGRPGAMNESWQSAVG
jgi:hypothetical protein